MGKLRISLLCLSMLCWANDSSAGLPEDIARWKSEGTAAGNEGDWYDNRDGDHSFIEVSKYPGLQKVKYSQEEMKTKGFGLQTGVRGTVTFGNSSTSGPIQVGGQGRFCYTTPQLLLIHHLQYRKNNLYVYPEHKDHDPGHNGPEGYGDLYPTNTPYLLLSQGSSGSDRQFLDAIAFSLAAFHPDVKAKLIETGMLMPTVQMIFRRTRSGIETDEDYLSGKAHPSVFSSNSIGLGKMVNMAHEMKADVLPPLARFKLIAEGVARADHDFFEPGDRSEVFADTPCLLSRIWRGAPGERRMLVSAEVSADPQQLPLTYHWKVLRGDPGRITITPKKDDNSVVEIRLAYHERMPVAPGAGMESNRVDIGLFVHNGTYYSPPAFITWYSLDNEKRSYDEAGRIREIDYTTGNFVDPRLTSPKPWRDEYHYEGDKPTGFTRHYQDGRTQNYTAEGELILAQNEKGEVTESKPVKYQLVPTADKKGRIVEPYIAER